MTGSANGNLKILHVMRAPVGGLFRHVVDLARGQAERGHRVGLVADASAGGAQAQATLTALSGALALGLSRIGMSRQAGWSDLAARAHVARLAAETGADVIHGHGSKGGAYARLAGANGAIRVYTPHGGSLHFDWRSPAGVLYLACERLLMARTDLFLFESKYGCEAFRAKVGDPGTRARVVHNGLAEGEFAPIVADPQASDLVFLGELRVLKGVDVLIEAVAMLARNGCKLTATIAGEGPDRPAFEAVARGQPIRFVGARPARAAFALGRVLVVPSRAESLPYVVLEAAAAGVPVIATRAGGIPEIYGPDEAALVRPGDPAALADAILGALRCPTARDEAARRLQMRVRALFSADVMTETVLAAYAGALTRRNG